MNTKFIIALNFSHIERRTITKIFAFPFNVICVANGKTFILALFSYIWNDNLFKIQFMPDYFRSPARILHNFQALFPFNCCHRHYSTCCGNYLLHDTMVAPTNIVLYREILSTTMSLCQVWNCLLKGSATRLSPR